VSRRLSEISDVEPEESFQPKRRFVLSLKDFVVKTALLSFAAKKALTRTCTIAGRKIFLRRAKSGYLVIPPGKLIQMK
jgi:hypothetical protein